MLEIDQEMCRCCMGSDKYGINLFEEETLELFKKFTHLEPLKDDLLPKVVCRNCKRLLDKFQSFYCKCLESDLNYKSLMLKKEENVVDDESKNMFEPFEDEQNSEDISCNDCVLFSDKGSFIKGEEIECPEEKPRLNEKQQTSIRQKQATKAKDRKKVTGRRNSSKLKPNLNSNKENGLESKVEPKIEETVESQKKKHKNSYLDKYRGHFICPVPACNKTFVFENSLKSHMIVHDPNYDPKSLPRPYICEHCGYAFKKEGQLNSHVRNKHGPAQEHSCRYCDEKFSTKTRLRLHVEKQHLPPKIYSCDICNKAVGRSHAAIRSHMIFIHLREDHPCTTCGKSFRRPFELRKHIEWVHLGESRFVCDICNAKFSSKQMLDYHSFHHSDGTKKFQCNYCDWASRKHADLKRHIDFFHLGIKRHTCQFCDKSFFDPKVKKHHEMTHTGERPEVCRICNKGFIQKVALKKHMLTHEKT